MCLTIPLKKFADRSPSNVYRDSRVTYISSVAAATRPVEHVAPIRSAISLRREGNTLRNLFHPPPTATQPNYNSPPETWKLGIFPWNKNCIGHTPHRRRISRPSVCVYARARVCISQHQVAARQRLTVPGFVGVDRCGETPGVALSANHSTPTYVLHYPSPLLPPPIFPPPFYHHHHYHHNPPSLAPAATTTAATTESK